MTLTDRVENEV